MSGGGISKIGSKAQNVKQSSVLVHPFQNLEQEISEEQLQTWQQMNQQVQIKGKREGGILKFRSRIPTTIWNSNLVSGR